MVLARASEACRSPSWHSAMRALLAIVQITQGRKRAATSEVNDGPRRPGRPRDVVVAARDASQSRLTFGRTDTGMDSGDNMEE